MARKQWAVAGGIGQSGYSYYSKYAQAAAVAKERNRVVRKYDPEKNKYLPYKRGKR